MKIFKVLLCCFFCFVSISLFSQEKKIENQLSNLIDSLYTADQSTAKIKPADSAAAAYQRVIRSNFPLVKMILDKYGFPGYNLVGQESSQHYFLLVQHSDFNLPFQKRVLKEMKPKVLNRNASGQNYAYLIDRININEGKPQIYGTQIIMSGNTSMKPCMDIRNLNKRRKSVGLSPIEAYLKKCNDAFYEMNPQEKKNY